MTQVSTSPDEATDLRTPPRLSRRATIPLVAAAVGASGYLLAACGDSESDDSPSNSGAGTTAPAGGAAEDASGAGGTGPASDSLASLDQVPAGGGLVLQDQKIVLTRESGDTVHAFSAVCTHQGCLVGEVSGGQIICPCHNSRFDAATGAPVSGPATSPLEAVAITVQDGGIFKS